MPLYGSRREGRLHLKNKNKQVPALARRCINDWGADIINDVSEGGLTGIVNTPIHEAESMFDVVGELKCPYILMSVKPTLGEMIKAFAGEIQQLRDRGAKDIILDPGFGFGKTLEQNYDLMAGMAELQALHLPILVGISRKSMIWKLIGGTPATSLPGTTALTGGGTRRLDTARPRCGRGGADRGGGRENEAITNQRSYITCFLILA